jgi:hypothetical protein
MDYQKTFEQYQQYGMGKKFENLPEYSRYEKEQGWYDKVKSPRSGEYYQAGDLISNELVPQDWVPPTKAKGKPVKYPIIRVNEIIRKRLVDGNEWLLSRKEMIALDFDGNEVNISMIDKEKYNDVFPIYTLKPENPKDNPRYKYSKMVRTIDRLQSRIKYTELFKPETAQKLYDMKNGECSLCVIDESGGDHPPVTVTSFEHFKSTPFDELWEMVTTPRFKMDRSYWDNLDNSHIG